MAKLKHCRICLGDDGDDTAFTAPCLCKGTIKWVHVDCLTDWRQSQMQAGQAEDMNRCTMCKAKFRVRRKQKWASLLNYKGYLMKICIQLSVAMANYSTTFNTTALLAMIQAYITNFATRLSMVSGTDIPIQFLSLLSTNLFSIAPTDLASTASPTMSYVAYAMYAPFPVCSSHYSSYPLPSTTRVLQKLRSPFDKNLPAKEVVQPFIHYILAPFTDNRLWYFLLCYCQHLHLGFFFLGSVYNVFTTYSVLNEMYDLVLEELGDHEGDPDHPHQPVALQRYKNAIKKFLLVYSSMLGMIVWIHYNLVAFRGWQQRDLRKLPEHVPNQAFSSHLLQVITLSSSQLDRMDSHDPKSAPISMDDFLLELPLWTLRWMTLAFAVFDFSVRRVYRWVARHVYRIDAEEVINLEE
ncbi:hypothetical protein BZG36_00031 [Bifiguratus adelaidae]|uniref:RING-CH-type domain-containing protein n=1 Tax=Bifiguratus adelaidae TaxID=1938954 RepID=A0A261Y8V2_9FUNG|nr:hypothetical protein BZG36_00031 [Bifiguratus adelaidae]